MKEEAKEVIIKSLKWIVVFLCLICFLILAKEVISKEVINLDIIGYRIISDCLISDFATPIIKFITHFGGRITLILITIVLVIAIKNKKVGLSISINLCTVALLNFILKQIIQRPRPTSYRIIDETGYSFPSGHSMIGMAFYGFLIYLIYKYVKNKYIKISLIAFLTILTLTVGISRIYLGVHYTSDVLAGFLMSIAYLVLYITCINELLLEKERN